MAYNSSQPPVLLAKGKGLTAPRFWHYATGDTAAQVQKKNYFTTGAMAGMRLGDPLLVADISGTQPPVMGVVTGIDGGAVTVRLADVAGKAKASKPAEPKED